MGVHVSHPLLDAFADSSRPLAAARANDCTESWTFSKLQETYKMYKAQHLGE